MSITAKAVWGKALAEFNKLGNTPGGVPFSYISNVNKAYENYMSVPSEDNFGDLYIKTLKAYERFYNDNIRKNQEYSDMVSTLFAVAIEKMNGDEFKGIISSCKPDILPFLAYFHECIKNQFISKAEQERADNANLNNGFYIKNKKSKEAYRKISEISNRTFGCNPEECGISNLDKLYILAKEEGAIESVTFSTFKKYITDNGIKAAPVFSEEEEDIDPYDNIASPDDIDKQFYDNVDEPVSMEGTETQIYYFGIITTHNWLYDVYQKEKEDDSGLYITALTDEYNELQKTAHKILKCDSNKFDEGCEKVFLIIRDHIKKGNGFPTMDTVSKELGFTGQATITRNAKKLADKLRRLLKS